MGLSLKGIFPSDSGRGGPLKSSGPPQPTSTLLGLRLARAGAGGVEEWHGGWSTACGGWLGQKSGAAGRARAAAAGSVGRARRGSRSEARPTRTEERRGEASSGRGGRLRGGAGEGGARPAADTIMRLRSSGGAVWRGELGPSQDRAGAASSGPSPGGRVLPRLALYSVV